LAQRSFILPALVLTIVWTSPGLAEAQACTAPIEGDIGCLGAATGRIENADGDDVMGSCGGGILLNHPDNVFTFTCSGAGTVGLSVTGMNCDIDLFVLGPGDCTTVGGCHAQSTNGLTPLSAGAMLIDEMLTFSCTPNETYYVVLDAFGQTGQTDCAACGFVCSLAGCSAAYPPTSNVGNLNCDDAMMEGDYTLTVTSGGSLGCGEHCADLVDNDGDGDVDCADADCMGVGSCTSCSGCDIGGSCVADGTVNPSNACEVCNVSASTTGWSPAIDGTSCADSMVCDGREVCGSGACVAGPMLDCDDADACTTDSCGEPSGCVHAAVSGCCNLAIDCDDADLCTVDECTGTGGSCTHAAISGCCTDDGDCADSSTCTTDACDLSTNRCVFTPVAGCCAVAADCDDGNACTTDACDASTGACANDVIVDCCLGDGDCDDDDVCTADACASSACVNISIDGCCLADDACDDTMECTEDTCDVRTLRCIFDAVAVCCGADAECDDGDECTIDSCGEFGVCDNAPDPACCDVDCNDDDVCTADSCAADRVTCFNDPIDGCCAGDGDCVAPMGCVAGRCATAADSGPPDGGLPPAPEDGGCGCASPGRSPAGGALLLGFALLCGLFRRRPGD